MKANDNKPNGKKVRKIELKIAKLEAKRQAELNPKPHATKEERKARRVARRAERLQKLRGLRPFNLKCVKWYEKRLLDIANGLAGDSPAPAEA